MTARLRDCMPLLDRLCYLGWRLTRRTTPISVRLHQGIKFRIQPWPAMDIAIAHEVFVSNVYDPPDGVHLRPDSVRRAVDLGANIGCTCLLWLSRYPKVRVEAFEPHPTYAALLRHNLGLNGWGDRVNSSRRRLARPRGYVPDIRRSFSHSSPRWAQSACRCDGGVPRGRWSWPDIGRTPRAAADPCEGRLCGVEGGADRPAEDRH